MPVADSPSRSTELFPTAPATLEEAGLSRDLLTQLVLKTLHLSGEMSASDIAQRLGLAYTIVAPSLETLYQQLQVEIVGGLLVGEPTYRYRITDAGRTRAALYLSHSQYVGVAPVPLVQYRAYLKAFAALGATISRERVHAAFHGLVLSDRVLDEIGPAVGDGQSILLYGPPGNGKTSIAHAIRALLEGEIAVPHAIDVDGHTIQLFDPVSHEMLPSLESSESNLEMAQRYDKRWVRCRRPLVAVGGELTLDALNLHYMPSAGYYRAPIQAVANGGVLIVDDFGRQQATPRELLNRWMVPLESRVDYLTLQSGLKFEMPFLPLVVFATNLKPSELVDEAFLRRIQYKIRAESPTRDAFIGIFERCCRDANVPFDRSLVEGMLSTYFATRGIPLRGCQPRDIIGQALSLAGYLGRPRQLTAELLDEACESYFVDERDNAPY